MTLALYIPYANGSLLISDRQNTFQGEITITREPIDKIHMLTNLNSGIAFAGATNKCRHVIDKLRRIQNQQSFEDNYKQVYASCYGAPVLGFNKNDVELLVVSRQTNGTFRVSKMFGALPNDVDERKCSAIGSGAPYIQPQLELDTLRIDRQTAEVFGKTLLKFASLIDGQVGDPISYGYNVLVMNNENNEVETIHPDTVDFSKLIYNFDN